MVGIMKKSTGLIIFILAILSASLCLAGSSMDYPQNTGPSRTDEAIGIDNPAGAWSINRFPYGDILGLIEDGDIPSGIARDTEVVQAFGIHELTYDHTLINTALQPGDVLDEDDMASDSATNPPSQQSAKAYIDALVSYLESLISSAVTALSSDDSDATLTDNGVDPGVLTITLDGTVCATFAAAGNTFGNSSVAISSLTSDHSYLGLRPLELLTGGATIDPFKAAYYNGTTGKVAAADASVPQEAHFITVTSTTDTNPVYVLREGYIRDDTWNWSAGYIYLDTSGGFTQTPQSTSNYYNQIVGYMVTADVAYFNFNWPWVTVK
jgi:hypothetical protein